MCALRADGNSETLPWMWALNGAASVVAVVLSLEEVAARMESLIAKKQRRV